MIIKALWTNGEKGENMKIGKIHPCICIERNREAGDSGFLGMPNLKIYQGSPEYPECYVPYCPSCGRGGIKEYPSAFMALKAWNALQESLWEMNGGKPLDDAPKPEQAADPRDGYGEWHKTHQILRLPEGEHFMWKNQECRIRSDGKAVLSYDPYDHDWLKPGYRSLQLCRLLEEPEKIEPLPFDRWHVESSEPSYIWKRYVDQV